jgi:ribosomal protein S18 acetylase RimI-like enzyme
LDKPLTLTEEKIWLKNQIQANKKGEQISLKALVNDHLIGLVLAQRGMYRNRGNVMVGIALRKHWRGRGLGWILMQELIAVVEQRWHPLHIYLHVVSSNTKACALYKSLGFRMIARLPQWFEYNGKYLDEYILILDKKCFQKAQKKIL